MAETRREFSATGTASYDQRSAVRWVWSHLIHYPVWLSLFLVAILLANTRALTASLLTGAAFDEVTGGDPERSRLLTIVLVLAGAVIIQNAMDLCAALTSEVLAARFARDTREELFTSLLGKSQTFHNRQRVGDIMARATNDVSLLRNMVTPGIGVTADSLVVTVAALVGISTLDWRLLLVPVIFVISGLIALRHYSRELAPVSGQLRMQFGITNARLQETIGGIEVVKSSAQEVSEAETFEANTRRYRDLFVRSGRIQARYLPLLLLAIAGAFGFLHGVYLYSHDQITLGQLAAFIGLIGSLRVPAGLSIWTVNLVQLGFAAAARILGLIKEETELDEESAGHTAPMRGEIVFDDVNFSYGEAPVLKNLSFRVEPGQTVAIVGQTGSGKSTLTKLVNRTYDVDGGRILVDGVDVRAWSLDSLRSQISTIEQDVFLFSRSIAANIAFGAGPDATNDAILAAARDAQADGFIGHFSDGYETVIGERGVTLSGGQRQRLAIARALLTDPRVLILDDATSAIDSATEDEIQLAIKRIQEGRTTLLITHRLSQIRWADKVLVVHHGELVAEGTHDDLLQSSELYRRIFSHYEPALPPALEPVGVGGG